jgi:hypothetical protein
MHALLAFGPTSRSSAKGAHDPVFATNNVRRTTVDRVRRAIGDCCVQRDRRSAAQASVASGGPAY